MNLLSLDQSSRITGYAIFQDEQLIKYGKIELEDKNIGLRLYKLRQEIEKIIKEYNIEFVIFEDIQLQSNVQNNISTFKILSEVFGVIYELLTEMKIPNKSILAVTWKSKLKIKGKTRQEQKKSAQSFVLEKYNIKPTQDEADAICIGLSEILNQDFDWAE